MARSTALRHLEYHAWATTKTFESVQPLSHEELLRDMRTSHSSVFGTLEHVYKADTIWLKRLRGESSAKFSEVEPVSDLTDLQTKARATQTQLISLAGSLSDADWTRVIDYRMLSGQEARSPIYENILHVVNHGPIIADRSSPCCGNWARSRSRPTSYASFLRRWNIRTADEGRERGALERPTRRNIRIPG